MCNRRSEADSSLMTETFYATSYGSIQQASERGKGLPAVGNTAWLTWMDLSYAWVPTPPRTSLSSASLLSKPCRTDQSFYCPHSTVSVSQARIESITMAQTASSIPPATVSVHALSCGHFTLPEHQFVKPSSGDARRTVPSLAFLIQHVDTGTGNVARILFDLGLRRDLGRYPLPIQQHIENRRPITTVPDVTKTLAQGGLTPDDIHYIIYSHVGLLLCILLC